MSKLTCEICPHSCTLDHGQTGLCRARGNTGDCITAINYGKVTSMGLDPIEKKPLYHYFPGSVILSTGSFGCNLRCPFCQNYDISTADSLRAHTKTITPEELANFAVSLRPRGNIGVAYTYNEPLVGYEFVRDCAKAVRDKELKNVVVTNGYINEKPFKELLPLIDALNIDLKAFTESFYKRIGGALETVKHSIKIASEACHVEVTTLVIPGENDSEEEINSLAGWLASVSRDIPLHLTRFFPNYKMTDKDPTSVQQLHRLADLAREHLQYVYVGNC